MSKLIDQILREWLWRLDDPRNPDVNNPTHLYHLKEALESIGLSEDFITEFGGNLTEKDDDKTEEDNEYEELLQKTIKDPDTGNDIKIKTALDKEESTAVYKAAERELAKLKGSDKTTEFPDDVEKDDKIKVGNKTYRKDMLSQPEIDKLEKESEKESETDKDKLSKDIKSEINQKKWSDPVKKLFKENQESKIFKKEFKEAVEKLKDFDDDLESSRVTKRIDNSKQTVANLESVLDPETPIKPLDKKRTIADNLLGKGALKYRVEVPSAQRGSTIDKLKNDFEKKGYDVTLIKRAGAPKGITIEKNGVKEVIEVKPGGGKKSRAEALAFEGSVALAFGIAAAGGTTEDATDYIAELMNGKDVTAGDINVSIKNLRNDALEWWRDPSNAESAKKQLDMLMENKDQIATNLAASKKIAEEKFPPGTKISVECEGGADTDEFRADVVTYANTPDGKKVALVGISVKDGNSQTLGQLGAAKAHDAITTTKPGTPERKAALAKYFNQQSSKLPDSMREEYENKLLYLDDPEKLHSIMLDSVLENDDPDALHDLLVWSIVGKGEHDDLTGFIYQNASRTYNIPLPGSPRGAKIKECIANMMKEGKFKKAGREKSDFTEDLVMEVDGEPKRVVSFRTKRNMSGKVDRSYIEKGGGKSIMMALLNGKYCK